MVQYDEIWYNMVQYCPYFEREKNHPNGSSIIMSPGLVVKSTKSSLRPPVIRGVAQSIRQKHRQLDIATLIHNYLMSVQTSDIILYVHDECSDIRHQTLFRKNGSYDG